MPIITDQPVPIFTTVAAIGVGSALVRLSDGKHFTKVSASQGFCHDSQDIQPLVTGDACLGRVVAEVIFN